MPSRGAVVRSGEDLEAGRRAGDPARGSYVYVPATVTGSPVLEVLMLPYNRRLFVTCATANCAAVRGVPCRRAEEVERRCGRRFCRRGHSPTFPDEFTAGARRAGSSRCGTDGSSGSSQQPKSALVGGFWCGRVRPQPRRPVVKGHRLRTPGDPAWGGELAVLKFGSRGPRHRGQATWCCLLLLLPPSRVQRHRWPAEDDRLLAPRCTVPGARTRCSAVTDRYW